MCHPVVLNAVAILIPMIQSNLYWECGHIMHGPKRYHSYIAEGRLCLIDSDFDIITFGAWCFTSSSAALSFQYVLTWEIASPLTYGYLSARWKYICSLSIVTAIVLVWSAGYGVIQLKNISYWGRVSSELDQLSELVTAWLSGLWESRTREELWDADTGVILATSWS